MICAEPRLAELGGRFWFSLDDGRADVSGLGADVGVHFLQDDCALLLTGHDTGVRLALGDVIRTLVEVAVRFVEVRGKAWRVKELDDVASLLPGATLSATTCPPVTKAPVGWINQEDGRVTLGAAVPLGVLPASVAEYLAAARRTMDAEAAAQFEQNCREMYVQMARIAITPRWVRFYDFRAGRMPRFLIRSRP